MILGHSRWTVAAFFDHCANVFSDQEYLVFNNQRLTYEEFREWTRKLSGALLALGFQKGDRLMLWVSNFPEWVGFWFACMRIGVVPVPVNTRFRGHELKDLLNRSRAKGVLIMGDYLGHNYSHLFQEVVPAAVMHAPGEWKSADFPNLQWLISIEESPALKGALSIEHVMLLGQRMPNQHVDRAESSVRPEDLGAVLFTSGTTSFPKGVLLAQGQIILNGMKAGDRLGYVKGDRLLITLPFSGSFMCLNGIFAATSHGAAMVLMDHFDAGEALRLIEEEKVTVIYGPDTVFRDLIDHPDRPNRNLSTWQKGMGAPIYPHTLRELILDVGVKRMVQGYGLTETCAVCTIGEPEEELETRIHSCGKALPGVEVAVCDPETGRILPRGETGEVVVRGPSITLGYEGNPLATVAATLPGGWFRTGDVGRLDDRGNLFLQGRLKDMLKVGGFSVSAQEIEAFLMTFPEVKEAAVVGIPDPRLQEVPAAFVQLHPGARLDPEEFFRRCEQIANYKRPRRVEFIETFPRTSTGKIVKMELRERLK